MNMKQQMVSWLRTTHWDVFGCLNFKRKPTEMDAQKILAYFWNKVDRHYFGNASDHITNAFSQLRDFQYEKFLIINELMAKFSNPQYNNN
jgi:SMC interacting uncharacterized protein involved in chromosome segregation